MSWLERRSVVPYHLGDMPRTAVARATAQVTRVLRKCHGYWYARRHFVERHGLCALSCRNYLGATTMLIGTLPGRRRSPCRPTYMTSIYSWKPPDSITSIIYPY